MKIENVDDIVFVLAFFIPGFICLSVRNQFIASRAIEKEDKLFRYLTATAFNYAFSFPMIYILLYNEYLREKYWLSAFGWAYVLLISPMILGVLGVVASHKGFAQRISQKLGLRLIHFAPTAWDWQFGRLTEPSWVLVRLADGSEVAGLFGGQSMASSERDSRDLFIEKVYNVAQTGSWSEAENSGGIYIPHGQIKSIEFWPAT